MSLLCKKYRYFLTAFLAVSCSFCVAQSPETVTVEFAQGSNVSINNFTDVFDQVVILPQYNDTPSDFAGSMSGVSLMREMVEYDYTSAPKPTALGGRTFPFRWDTSMRYFKPSGINFNWTTKTNVATPYDNLNVGNANYSQLQYQDNNWYASSYQLYWNNIQNDFMSIFFPEDFIPWIVGFLSVYNNLPTTADVTYTLPPIFGFNTGLSYTIPFGQILQNSGQFSFLSSVFTVIRAMLGFCYYATLIFIVLRCVFLYT